MNVARLSRVPWWKLLLERFIPALRRRREQRLREGIRWLVDHPDEPVIFR